MPGSLEDCEERRIGWLAVLRGVQRGEPKGEEIGEENHGGNEQACRMETHSESLQAALIFISFERKRVTDLHSSGLSIPNRSAYPPEYFVAAAN